jgi:hypothetical protein
VAYLNGSKVLTTGSALTFDGTNFGVGGAAVDSATFGRAVDARGTTGAAYYAGTSDSTTRVLFGAYSGAGYLSTITNHPLVFSINSAEQMRLTSTGLGIGTSSPAAKLDVFSTASRAALFRTNQAFAGIEFNDSGTSTNPGIFGNGNAMTFWAGAAERMRLDSSGNLGLGVTPSAIGSAYRALQIGSATGVTILGGSGGAEIGANNYYDGSNYRYATTAAASLYAFSIGQHRWYTAPSGTAGNAISFTQVMTLDASGKLNLGTTASSATFSIRPSSDAPNTVHLLGDGNVIYGSLGFDSHTGGGGNFRIASTNAMTFLTNGSERARIDSSGNLLVGTSSFTTGGIQKTIVSSGTASAGFQIQLSGNVGSYIYGYTSGVCGYRVETTSSYPNIQMVSGGTGGVSLSSGATAWASMSDERLKTNLLPITDAVEKVCSLRTVTGRYESDDVSVSRAFLIAQDVQAVLPEAVTTIKQKDDDAEYLGLQYTDTIPLLVAAIKELKAEFDAYKLTHP